MSCLPVGFQQKSTTCNSLAGLALADRSKAFGKRAYRSMSHKTFSTVVWIHQMGVSQNRVPLSHPFKSGFPLQTSYWGTPNDYGNPQIHWTIFASNPAASGINFNPLIRYLARENTEYSKRWVWEKNGWIFFWIFFLITRNSKRWVYFLSGIDVLNTSKNIHLLVDLPAVWWNWFEGQHDPVVDTIVEHDIFFIVLVKSMQHPTVRHQNPVVDPHYAFWKINKSWLNIFLGSNPSQLAEIRSSTHFCCTPS